MTDFLGIGITLIIILLIFLIIYTKVQGQSIVDSFDELKEIIKGE